MADITITEGDTLEVDYNLENTGDGTGTFDPRLLVQGVQEDQDTGITLDPAQTATGTLQWPTESGDAVTDALAEAVTDDTSDSITVTVESAIPDSGMFQDAQYQFWAGSILASDGDSPVPFPEVLADLPDATAVGGPIYRVDKNGQYDAVEYDGVDDSHDWDGEDGSVSGDTWSIAALVWVRAGSSQNSAVFSWGTTDTAVFSINGGNQLTVQIGGVADPGLYGTVPQGEFVTVGVSFDTGDYRFYVNGSPDGSENSGTPDSINAGNIGLAYERAANSRHFDGFVVEEIISNTQEPDQAFSDYHTNRLG